MNKPQDSDSSVQAESCETLKGVAQSGEVAKSTELDAEQLDKVAAGIGGGIHGPSGPGG